MKSSSGSEGSHLLQQTWIYWLAHRVVSACHEHWVISGAPPCRSCLPTLPGPLGGPPQCTSSSPTAPGSSMILPAVRPAHSQPLTHWWSSLVYILFTHSPWATWWSSPVYILLSSSPWASYWSSPVYVLLTHHPCVA